MPESQNLLLRATPPIKKYTLLIILLPNTGFVLVITAELLSMQCNLLVDFEFYNLHVVINVLCSLLINGCSLQVRDVAIMHVGSRV